MTLRYVGIGGNDGNSGLSWALRKLTLNGAEDTPVVAGDTVYVGAGTYREQLTCDVSGSAGNPITYIGDYSGENTDGVGGVVRITGSDDDITATRTHCITANAKNYRTFQSIKVDLSTSRAINIIGACSNTIINRVFIGACIGDGIYFLSATNFTVQNSYIAHGQPGYTSGILIIHATGQSDSGDVIENNIIVGSYQGIRIERVGGVTIKNCNILNSYFGVRIGVALPAGQTATVNNNVLYSLVNGLYATALDEITEDYNSFYGNVTDRTNVAIGANSNAYPPLFDSRWFFEQAVKNRKLVTPLDLSENSQLINVAGTSPTTTDLRGMSVQGAQREWGALEYYAALSKGDGISRGRLV